MSLSACGHCLSTRLNFIAMRRFVFSVCSVLLLAARPVTSFDVALSEPTLWAIRSVSAIGSYVSLVAWVDRPKGVLYNQQSLVVSESNVPGAGLGLFATAALSKGTILGTYPGVVLPLTQNLNKLREYPSCEGYVWRFSDNQRVIDPTNSVGILDDICTGGNPSLPLSVELFQTVLSFITVPTTLCRINEPPRGFDVNVITEEDTENRCVTFSLERDIAAGEELFIDYGLSYDRSMYGGGDSASS